MDDDTWPKRTDGTNKRIGEMNAAERLAVFKEAGKRLEAEFNNPAHQAAMTN